jgi:hypothetical protein
MDLLLARKEPEGEMLRDDVVQVLRMMRRPQWNPCETTTPSHPRPKERT